MPTMLQDVKWYKHHTFNEHKLIFISSCESGFQIASQTFEYWKNIRRAKGLALRDYLYTWRSISGKKIMLKHTVNWAWSGVEI